MVPPLLALRAARSPEFPQPTELLPNWICKERVFFRPGNHNPLATVPFVVVTTAKIVAAVAPNDDVLPRRLPRVETSAPCPLKSHVAIPPFPRPQKLTTTCTRIGVPCILYTTAEESSVSFEEIVGDQRCGGVGRLRTVASNRDKGSIRGRSGHTFRMGNSSLLFVARRVPSGVVTKIWKRPRSG